MCEAGRVACGGGWRGEEKKLPPSSFDQNAASNKA